MAGCPIEGVKGVSGRQAQAPAASASEEFRLEIGTVRVPNATSPRKGAAREKVLGPCWDPFPRRRARQDFLSELHLGKGDTFSASFLHDPMSTAHKKHRIGSLKLPLRSPVTISAV